MDGVLRGQEKLSIINQIPLFADLIKTHKKLIAVSSSIAEYKKGEIIYSEGGSPDAFYCVVTGRVRAYITRHNNQEDLEYLKRGRYFGTVSLLTGETHSATIQAVNDSIILKIPKDSFDHILKRVPELAIHFSRTLSRQIRLKEVAEKKIFESTIISVFGTSSKIGTSRYIFNLGVGLKNQTGKKVILVKVCKEFESADHSETPLSLKSPFFDARIVASSIFRHDAGMDMINILHHPKETAHLAPFLTYLTDEYHYVLVDLPCESDDATFEALKQSDAVHLITASDRDSLFRASKVISELTKTHEGMSYKVKVITAESGVSEAVAFAERQEILKHEIFATFPDSDHEYPKMIRRISRQIGACQIGLALGAGASQGFAHIGILKVIERENIPIDMVSGTSMGAAIGALWVSGKSAAEIEDSVLTFRKKIRALRLVDLAIPRRGLIRGREIRRFLASQFGNKTFHDLKMPLKIIVCDIERREEVVLESGSITDAVMASLSIPGMFEPVKIDGKLLVDGGITNPLPTDVLTRSGVAKVIAVNALPSPEDVQKFKKKDFNIFDMIVRNIQGSEYLLAEASAQNADIAMHPVLAGVDWYELYEVERIIRRGEEEAMKYLPKLKELAAAR